VALFASHSPQTITIMLICGGSLLPLVAVVAAAIRGSALDTGLHNAQGVNFWRLHHRTASARARTTSQQGLVTDHSGTPTIGEPQAPLVVAGATPATPAEAEAVSGPTTPKFHPQTFTQPLDHFHNTTDATFPQRFWVNSRHYKPRTGAPVIVIDGGETSGEDRLPFLDTGIADILARATGGVGVVLEHRYYGACLTHVSCRPVLSSGLGGVLGDACNALTYSTFRQVYRRSELVDRRAQVRASLFPRGLSSYTDPPLV